MNSGISERKEDLLLLSLCRLKFSEAQIAAIRALIPEINDWDYFGTLANEHGVSALVWHNLEKFHLQAGIGKEVCFFLRSAYLKSLSRNTFHTESTAEVLRLLNKENIKTVILKGLALEHSVYGNSGLRQMSDVDILVTREECLRARDILTDSGFVSLPVKSVFHKFIAGYSGKHLPSLIKAGASIEIHTELFGGKNDHLTRILYESSYESDLKGEKAWFPQPFIFFLYLIRHLNNHEVNNESQLRLYTDLVVLIEKFYDKILNADLIKYASEAGMSEIVADHLEPLREFWKIDFPQDINYFIDRYKGQDNITRFIFFLGSPKDNQPADNSVSYRQVINDIPGFHRKFLYVLGDIFPTIRFMKKRYGCNSTFRVLFYYPHRLGKIAWLFK